MVNPRTLIFHISGLSSTPSLYYVLPTWPVDLLIHGQPTNIDLPYQWSVLNPFPTLRPPHLTSGSSYPWSTHEHWSSISVVCPQPLPYITSSPPDQWIFLSMVNPRTLIFHISGLSSTPSQHYVLPNWPVDLLIHGQPTAHWSSISMVCPQPLPYIMSFQTDHWIFLSMVNPRTLIFHISGLSSTPSLHYVLPNWPVDLLIHGQPTDPLIFHISGLSSTPSVHYVLPTDQWIFLSMVNPQALIFHISGLSLTPSH